MSQSSPVTPRPGLPDSPWVDARLSDGQFASLATYIEANAGIRMPAGKRVLLETRLRRRLNALKMSSFDQYCDYVFSSRGGDELVRMIDAVTTNKTEFFREPHHFEILTEVVLPELARRDGAGLQHELTIWSAGCSTGQEPYTLAMVLAERAAQQPELRFRIIATDICTQVLEQATRGIYPRAAAEPVPRALRYKYLAQSSRDGGAQVRVADVLRRKVRFARLNLLDESWSLPGPVDVVFCRNVFIYFERPTQERILLEFCQHMVPGGFVFLGHSETINGLRVPLRQVAPTVYQFLPTTRDGAW